MVVHYQRSPKHHRHSKEGESVAGWRMARGLLAVTKGGDVGGEE